LEQNKNTSGRKTSST